MPDEKKPCRFCNGTGRAMTCFWCRGLGEEPAVSDILHRDASISGIIKLLAKLPCVKIGKPFWKGGLEASHRHLFTAQTEYGKDFGKIRCLECGAPLEVGECKEKADA